MRPTALDLARILLNMLRQLGYWKPADPAPGDPDPSDDHYTTVDQVRQQALIWHAGPVTGQAISGWAAWVNSMPRFPVP